MNDDKDEAITNHVKFTRDDLKEFKGIVFKTRDLTKQIHGLISNKGNLISQKGTLKAT